MYNKNLPDGLTNEEEQVLAEQIQYGPPELKVEARNKLIEHNLKWILSVANSLGNGLDRHTLEDLRSFAVETALDSTGSFKPKGFKFITYLGRFFYVELLRYKRQTDSIGRHLMGESFPVRLEQTLLSTDPHLDEEGLNSHTWEETIADENAEVPDQAYDRIEIGYLIRDSLQKMERRESDVLRLYFNIDYEDVEESIDHEVTEERGREGGLTLEDIGARLGCTRENVRLIKNRGLKHLRHPSFQKKFQAYRSI